jgi:hypothetical protein
MTKHLFVGGLVAAGFDASGKFLLTVSHAGRGVFSVGTWERVARDTELAYPDGGYAVGIGPIEGKKIKVKEDYEGVLELTSPDGVYHLSYDEGTITITNGNA